MLGFRDGGTGQFTGPAQGTGTKPDLLYRTCWGLALLTEVYRRGPDIAALGPLGRLPRKSARSLLDAAPDAGLEQLAALRGVMESALLPAVGARHGLWAIGPVFAGSQIMRGDADLIAGGLLTELVSWQSIFLLQVPVALAAAVPIFAVARHEAATGVLSTELRRTGRPHVLANIALAMVSAAIAAALFLLVLLLIEGWRLTPIGAAIVVSVMPLSALLGSRFGRLVPSARARAAAGTILVSGGLGGLALLPHAEVALTVPPQIMVGIGLALVLSALTETALSGRAPQAIHGGWTISARHAGVVIGLLALTPIFTHDIAAQRNDAIDAGTAVILDSRVPPLIKIELAQRIETRLEGERGKVPTIGSAFDPLPSDPEEREAVVQLRDELQEQLNRAATHAFSPSFGLAALLGLLALIPIGLARRVEL